MPIEERSHIAIAGGGFTGLVCALKLLQAGYKVTLLEARQAVGGLTSSYDFGPFRWDRFYHCILTSDSALLRLLDELGLAAELRWTTTEVGFFSHGELYKMTGPRDLLRFPHLSLRSKVRLGLATIYASHLKNGSSLEGLRLEQWTRRLFGSEVYREIWEPLFRCKLGEMRHQASAAFLWGTLRRLYSTREDGPSKQEKLGYVRGGYGVVFDCLTKRVLELGGDIETGVPITSIRAAREGAGVDVRDPKGTRHFDGAVITLPNRATADCLVHGNAAYTQRLKAVQYLGLICVVLLLRKKLSLYYVTNITEESPFTGIIEMTNLIRPDEETAGFHLVYLPRYTSSDDWLFEASEDDVWKQFSPKLQHIHPELTDERIVARFLFRERFVQPVPTLNYSKIVPPQATPVPGVYLANTAQIVNNTLNNNVMTEIATATCNRLMQDIPIRAAKGAACSIAS